MEDAYVNGNIMEGYPEVTKDNWNGGVQVEEMPMQENTRI
jgi:hypothetical protein